MKITIVCVIVALAGEIQFTSSQVDFWDGGRRFYHGIKGSFTGVGRKFIHAKRQAFYGCQRGSSDVVNVSYYLGSTPAEYHFYKQQKIRDINAELLRKNKLSVVTYAKQEFKNADDALTSEYYCEDTNSERLKDICWYAVNKNSHMSRTMKREAHFEENPECELRTIYIERYNYETKRTLLRCPVVMLMQVGGRKKRSENDRRPQIDYIYIMSTENAAPGRLMFYLLMPHSSERLWTDNALITQSQSVEYEAPRVNTRSRNDRDEDDRQKSPVLEPGRTSLGSISEIEPSRTDSNVPTESTSNIRAEGTSNVPAAESTSNVSQEIIPFGSGSGARTPGRTLSVTDYHTTPVNTNVDTRFQLPRSTRSTISFDRSRSSRQATDRKPKRPSQPSRKYSRALTRLETSKEDKSSYLDPTHMRINALLTNRRHTSGHTRDEFL